MIDVGGFPTRILIVDDNERIRESLRARIAVSSPSYIVGTAADGSEALTALRTAPFDVVLCDLKLRGDMDGVAVTHKVREEHPQVRVVVFSGKDEGASKIEVLNAGAYCYLSKPINYDELLHAIRTINSIRRTEKLHAWFQTLARISYDLQASFDFDWLAERIVDGAIELGYARSRLYLFDAERQILVGGVARGMPDSLRFQQYEIPFEASPMIAELFESDRPSFWNKDHIMAKFGRECAEPWIRDLGLEEVTWIDCPMLVRNKRIGTLGVDNQGRPDYHYTEEDRQIMGLFAGMAAQALNNSRLYQKEALANASLRSIIRDAPDAVVTTDLDGTLNFVSPSIEWVLGYMPDEIIGRRAHNFYTDEHGSTDAGRPEARRIMAQLRRGGTIANRKVYLRDPSGKPRPTALSVSLLTNELGEEIGTLGFIKDLAPFKEQSRQYQDLLEGFGYGILLLTTTGTIGFVNRKAERLLGRWREHLIRESFLDLVLASQRPELEGGLLQVRDGAEEVRCDLSLVRPDGHRHPVKATLTPVRTGTELTGVALALYDKSELDALIRSGRLMALGETVAGVAHEVRNPLNHIMLAAQEVEEDLELEGRLPAAVRESLHMIHRNGVRIRDIIHHLRKFARPNEFQSKPLSLNEVVRETLPFFATRFRHNNIELVVELDPDLPEVLGDSNRLQQVLINLIANAEEAMRGQSEPMAVHVESRFEPPDGVCLYVSDTGSGIPEGIRDAIFDPFFTTKPPNKGTGLGLSISKSVIDLHEGTIAVADPERGRGARFRIRLPRASGPEGSPGHGENLP